MTEKGEKKSKEAKAEQLMAQFGEKIAKNEAVSV